MTSTSLRTRCWECKTRVVQENAAAAATFEVRQDCCRTKQKFLCWQKLMLMLLLLETGSRESYRPEKNSMPSKLHGASKTRNSHNVLNSPLHNKNFRPKGKFEPKRRRSDPTTSGLMGSTKTLLPLHNKSLQI
ncbi:hypothetical protein WN944_027861 [Citrus x changshan-huyou]|uniref:Uncharacterized protein n=1 Tax=Citrus x changshan-huyou TaxID=2935761 RepID=A0AAP0QDC5_9ROSI